MRKGPAQQNRLADLFVARVTGDNRWNSCSELLNDVNSRLKLGRLKLPKAQRNMKLCLPLAYRHLSKEWQLLLSIIMVPRIILIFSVIYL